MKNLINLVVGIALMFLSTFCIATVYNWIVVPQFGVKDITMPVVFGLMALKALLGNKVPLEDKREIFDKIVFCIVVDLLMLLIGYLAHLAM